MENIKTFFDTLKEARNLYQKEKAISKKIDEIGLSEYLKSDFRKQQKASMLR